jgi:hypothetical protein
MTTNRKCVARLAVVAIASLLLPSCSPDSPPPEETKSVEGPRTSMAATAIPADPREFLAQAIQAHGGEAALARAKGVETGTQLV